MQLTEWIPAPSNWENLKYHPLSEIVGFGVGIDVDGLAAHMSEHGYDDGEPIVIWRDQILDGRHKHAGAKKAKVTPTFVRFVGKSAEAYVAKKAFRQHLSTSQKAMIAATIATAKDGRPGINSPETSPKTNAQAAATMKISEKSVKNAKKVIAQGTPTLQEAVTDGTVNVTDAAKIVDQPPEVQNKAVEEVKAGKAKTAAASAKPKAGKPKFSDKSFEKIYGPLPRFFDDRARATGAGPTRKTALTLSGNCHAVCMTLLKELIDTYKLWKGQS